MSPERRLSSKPSRSALSSPFYPRNTALSSTSSAYIHLARQNALAHTLSQIHHARLSTRSRHPKFHQLWAIYEEYVRQCELYRKQLEAHHQHPRPHQRQHQHHHPCQCQASFHHSDTPGDTPGDTLSPSRLIIPSPPPDTPSARSTDSGTDSAACTRSLNLANVRRHSYRAQTQGQGQDPSPVNHRHTSAGRLEPTPKEMSIRENDIVRRLLSSVTPIQTSLPAGAGSGVVGRENIEHLSHRLHRQRIRSRDTSPYSLHRRVRSAEPQISSSHPSMLSSIPDLVHSSPSPHSQAEDNCCDIVKQEDTDDSRPIGAIKREPDDEATPFLSPGTKARRSSSPRNHRYSPVSRSSSRSSDSSHGFKMMTTTTNLPSRECSCQTCNPCCTKDAPALPYHDAAKMQEAICPWGMPGLPQPIPHRRRPQRQSDEPAFKPDPSRVTINDKAWTPDEKRALYLAATQSRLPHQWSKIRGMTNLHRSDQEIETEYQKLFGHRTNGPADEDEDEDERKERDCIAGQYYRGGYRPYGMDRDTDGEADDENERARFMGYYGDEPRLVSMDARACQLLRKGVAHHRSHYRSVVSPRHGPPEPIRVPHFQLEKIPLRI